MAIYRPKYPEKRRDPQTGELVKTGKLIESGVWWCYFGFAGKCYRESTKQTLKTLAVAFEKQRRREVERQYAGVPAEATAKERIRSVTEALAAYQKGYRIGHREKSIAWVSERAAHVKRLLGSVVLLDLTEDRVRAYMRVRLAEGAGNRTINMEVDTLARATSREWRQLWPRLTRLEERHDVGRALSADEEAAILAAAEANTSPFIARFIRAALATGMRAGEIRTLQAGRLDWKARSLRVGRAKTEAGTGREIPMNDTLYEALSQQVAWLTEQFGKPRPEWYLFPSYGEARCPSDPTRPVATLKTAWESVRAEAGVRCRFHDLRHTALTKMAEAGVPESTMKALAGHMSMAMIERYSHIRMQAKREAVEALALPARNSKVDSKVSPKRQLRVVRK